MGVTLSSSKGDAGGAFAHHGLTLLTMTPYALYNRTSKTPGVILIPSMGDVDRAFAHHGSTLLTMTPYALYNRTSKTPGVILIPSMGDVDRAFAHMIRRAHHDNKNPAIPKSYESWFRRKYVLISEPLIRVILLILLIELTFSIQRNH